MVEALKNIPKATLLLYVITTSLALITLKLSASTGAPVSIVEGTLLLNINPYTLFGIFLYGLSFLLYLYLLSKFNLGYLVPITTGLIYVLVFIASFVVFYEVFTLIKIAGIGCVFAGLILLNKS